MEMALARKPSNRFMTDEEFEQVRAKDDEWSMPFLDKYVPPALLSDEERALKTKLRKMRKKARVANHLIETNRALRKKLRDHPIPPEGWPKHEVTDVTREQVSTLAGLGVPMSGIARFMHMDKRTLTQYYAEEMELGRIYANIEVATTFKSVATDRDHPGVVAAGKKWLESRAAEEWKEIKQIEHAKAPGDKRPTIDIRALDPEDRIQFKALLEKMMLAQNPLTAAPVISEQEYAQVEADSGTNESNEF